VVLLLAACISSDARAETDPLPSWNDGPAKRVIIGLVETASDKASPKFVPPEARVAVVVARGSP